MKMWRVWAFSILAFLLTMLVLLIFRILGGGTFGDYLALAQTFITFLLLPTVIYGFQVTAEEFKKSQSKPRLDLLWMVNGGQEPVAEIQPNDHTMMTLRPALINHGDAVARFYIVRFQFPDHLVKQICNWQFELIIGNKETWKRGPGEYIFTFISNGTTPSYPEDGLYLCNLELELLKADDWPDRYYIPYSIVSEHGKSEGHFVLHLREVSATEKS